MSSPAPGVAASGGAPAPTPAAAPTAAAAVDPVDGAPGARARPYRGPVRTIAVAGAKGGVGKSVIAANLAVALGRAGRAVLLFDADLALGDAARLLGACRRAGGAAAGTAGREASLADVLAGRARFADAVVPGPDGVEIIPATDPDPRLSHLSRFDQASLVALFSELDTPGDTLVVDTPSGLSDAALCPAGAAREVLIVTDEEGAALDDAVAQIHALATRYHIRRFRVVANATRSASHGLDLYGALASRVDPELDLLLDYAGSVPRDPQLAEAVALGRPVMEAFPRSASALAFARLAARAARWPRPSTPAGHIEFFVERLVQAAGPHLARATTA